MNFYLKKLTEINMDEKRFKMNNKFLDTKPTKNIS